MTVFGHQFALILGKNPRALIAALLMVGKFHLKLIKIMKKVSVENHCREAQKLMILMLASHNQQHSENSRK